MKKTIILIGGTGFIGSYLYEVLKPIFEVKIISSSQKKTELAWNYKDQLPQIFFSGDIIINCGRSLNSENNIRSLKVILDNLSPSQQFIHLSSNSILVKPSSFIASLFFRGDAYIREKKIQDRIINFYKAKNKIIISVLPTIVLGPGGSWNNFLEIVSNSTKVNIPGKAFKKKFKVIFVHELAERIKEIALSGELKKFDKVELFSKELRIEKLLNRTDLTQSKTNNTFFDNYMKNFITMILCSWLLPDRLVMKILNTLVSKNKRVNASSDLLSIQGLTRLYLS